MRCFLALEISARTRQVARKVQDYLRKADLDVIWVKANNLHLTIYFWPDLAPGDVAKVTGALEESAAKTSPIEVTVSGLGFFPSFKRARVFWLGLKEDIPGQLAELHKLLGVKMSLKGVRVPDKNFSPHLTLGRLKSDKNLTALHSLLKDESVLNQLPCLEQFTRLILYESNLTPDGPIYSPLATSRLEDKS